MHCPANSVKQNVPPNGSHLSPRPLRPLARVIVHLRTTMKESTGSALKTTTVTNKVKTNAKSDHGDTGSAHGDAGSAHGDAGSAHGDAGFAHGDANSDQQIK